MAWDPDELRVAVIGEFADATAWSGRDVTAYEAKLRAEKSDREAEYSREYYRLKVKAVPANLERYRERKRLDMRRRRGMREKLEKTRSGTTHHFTIIAKCNKLKCDAGKIGEVDCRRCGGSGVREVDGYLTCNTYENGQLAEIFLRVGKTGAEEGMYDEWAKLASVALQFGMPVEAICKLHHATQFEPAGPTKNKEIGRCTSILDFVVKYISKYIPKMDEPEAAPAAAEVRP